MKAPYSFPDGTMIEVDVLKTCDWLGIHRPLSELAAGKNKSFVLTHLPTGKIVLQARTKTQCTAARKVLKELDWSEGLGAVREIVHDLLDAFEKEDEEKKKKRK